MLMSSALDGAPGLYSARALGGDPVAGCADLLRRLTGVPPADRTAAFVCVTAVVGIGLEPVVTEGRLAGEIAIGAAGDFGFGYDPVFRVPSHDCTLAQIPAAEKNSLSERSHRSRITRVPA